MTLHGKGEAVIDSVRGRGGSVIWGKGGGMNHLPVWGWDDDGRWWQASVASASIMVDGVGKLATGRGRAPAGSISRHRGTPSNIYDVVFLPMCCCSATLLLTYCG